MGGGGDSGGGGTNTTISKTEPPAYVQPYSEQLMQRGSNLSNAPYNPYGGQRISSLTPAHEYGLQMTADRAINGSPVMNAAQQNLTQTAQGDFLNPATNPAWAPTAQAITDAYRRGTAAQTDAAFSRAGAFGGSAYNEMTAANNEALGNTLAKAAGDLYNNERTNQMRAAMFAPQMAEADYRDAQALLGVGDAQRGYEQQLLDQAYSDWNEAQLYPYRQLDVLGSTIHTASGGYGGSTSTQQMANPTNSSPLSGAIGGGLLGYGMANYFPQSGINPMMGAAGGALLGGLL